MTESLVEMKHISKSFPGVKALDDVSFNLRAGEVHALLGENGAGKSTLMKIMSGIYKKDKGTFKVNGKEVAQMNPRKARELGIAIVHQELNMCSHLTVAENIFLGREKHVCGVIQQKHLTKETVEILKYLHLDIEPHTIVGKLSISKQQMIEIAKVLSTNAQILIMDEPTSALTEKEANELFIIINNLKKKGYGIVYISHRLEELQHITDRVTVLRDGRYITTKNYQHTSLTEIISFMVGRKIQQKFPRIPSHKGRKILEVKNLNREKFVKNVSLQLFEGEILGIAGLMGAGRTELLRILFGIDKCDSGEIYLFDKKISVHSPAVAIQAGIVFVPEDRKKEGLFTRLSVKENISLANLDLVRGSWATIDGIKETSLTQKAIQSLKIKTPNQLQEVKNLSGGNQQKIVVGKWLVRDAHVVLFDEPTRGIDVAAKLEIYNLMNQLKKNKIGVLFVSSEMPEVIGMSDRLLVMCNGKVTANFDANTVTQDQVLYAATRYTYNRESNG